MTLRKMAVFVEGYTELLFVEKLIREIAQANSVYIEKRKIRGGGKDGKTPRKSLLLEARRPLTSETHFVLIYNCGNDELVKQRVLEEHENLVRGGFSRIVCIRDVYPLPASSIPLLERNLPKYIPTKHVVVDFILSVMEIEAWFLAEYTHFEKVDPTLTVASIHTLLGFHPEHEDMSLRPHPAADLHDCYSIVAKSYKKGDDMTLSLLDYSHFYITLTKRIDYLNRLCKIIDDFLSPPANSTFCHV